MARGAHDESTRRARAVAQRRRRAKRWGVRKKSIQFDRGRCDFCSTTDQLHPVALIGRRAICALCLCAALQVVTDAQEKGVKR